MLYQKLLTGDTPYHVSYSTSKCTEGFEEHRHPEAEFIFCIDGCFDIIIEGKKYHLQRYTLALIAPMTSHELPSCDVSSSKLVIEAGPSLLKRHFNVFSESRFTFPAVTLDENNPVQRELIALLSETSRLFLDKSQFSELAITGNIYKICGIILSEFTEISESVTRSMRTVANIEKALELIRNRYSEPITVDLAAEVTGYGKSNFCKIFKSIVGETFHSVLNRRRIETALVYLAETDMPVSEIASTVGFSDVKTFCRVFKSVTGRTAGERRRSKA